MIFKLIGTLLDGREDAKATIAKQKVLEIMDAIESESFSPDLREAIAFGFVRLVKRYGEAARAALPEHCRQNYTAYLDSIDLKRAADHFFSEARTNLASEDLTRQIVGVSHDLAGYYLLSRSWQGIDHTVNSNAPEDSAPIIGVGIDRRIHAFLEKFGQMPPLP